MSNLVICKFNNKLTFTYLINVILIKQFLKCHRMNLSGAVIIINQNRNNFELKEEKQLKIIHY